MLPDERVLSDVHLRHDEAIEPCTCFTWSSRAAIDSDGDLVVKRRRRRDDGEGRGTLKLHHTLDTRLADVGLQVWRGALLIADLLVSDPSLVRSSTVLELGCGCGLCGLLAARLGADEVFLTDVGDGVLNNASRNVLDNGCAERAHVRRLDWLEPWRCRADEEEQADDGTRDAFDWGAADVEALRRTRLILAADTVYDDGLTDHFVDRLLEIMTWLERHQQRTDPASRPPRLCCVLGMERRINFCADSLSVRAPALEHFVSALRTRARGLLECESMPLPRQAFEYERSKELQLFRITLSVGAGCRERSVLPSPEAEPDAERSTS